MIEIVFLNTCKLLCMKRDTKEKLYPPASIRDPSALQGELERRFNNKLGFATWKKSYFKLVDGHTLWFAESQSELHTKPQGFIGEPHSLSE
jgi:hypothetical protein